MRTNNNRQAVELARGHEDRTLSLRDFENPDSPFEPWHSAPPCPRYACLMGVTVLLAAKQAGVSRKCGIPLLLYWLLLRYDMSCVAGGERSGEVHLTDLTCTLVVSLPSLRVSSLSFCSISWPFAVLVSYRRHRQLKWQHFRIMYCVLLRQMSALLHRDCVSRRKPSRGVKLLRSVYGLMLDHGTKQLATMV